MPGAVPSLGDGRGNALDALIRIAGGKPLGCARDQGRCRTRLERCYTSAVPTTKPRYTVTDAGHLAEMLDAAGRRWPEVSDRRQLLLRLAEEGHHALAGADLARDASERRDRIAQALERIPGLVDTAPLLADEAWT